jgi:hypothetical protein
MISVKNAMHGSLHVQDNRQRKKNGVMNVYKGMLIMKNNNTHNGHGHSNG